MRFVFRFICIAFCNRICRKSTISFGYLDRNVVYRILAKCLMKSGKNIGVNESRKRVQKKLKVELLFVNECVRSIQRTNGTIAFRDFG